MTYQVPYLGACDFLLGFKKIADPKNGSHHFAMTDPIILPMVYWTYVICFDFYGFSFVGKCCKLGRPMTICHGI